MDNKGRNIVLYGSQREKKGAEVIFEEIIAEHFPNLEKETDP